MIALRRQFFFFHHENTWNGMEKRVKARQTGDGLFRRFILFNSLYTFWAVLFFTSFEFSSHFFTSFNLFSVFLASFGFLTDAQTPNE